MLLSDNTRLALHGASNEYSKVRRQVLAVMNA